MNMSQVSNCNITQSRDFTYLNNVTAGVLNINQRQPNLSSDNLKVMMDNTERIFIRTSAFDATLNIVETYGCAILAGQSGSGKTMISLMIASHFSKEKYNIHFVGDLSFCNIQDIVEPQVPTVIIFDDLFGQYGLSTSIDKYIYTFNSILYHFESGNQQTIQHYMKILITSRTEVLQKAISLLPKFEDTFLKQDVILDLSTSKTLIITDEQKAAILEVHMKEVDSEDVRELLKDPSLCQSITAADNKVLGFPGLCKLFARNYNKNQNAEDFFKNPLIYLKPEIKRLMQSGDTKTTAIILLVLCNGRVAIPDLGTDEARKKSGINRKVMLLQEFVQDRYLISTSIISAMRELTGILNVTELDEVHFIHPSIFDCAAVILAEMNLTFVIKHCPFKFIHEYIHADTVSPNIHPSLLKIPRSYFKVLAERFAEEIRQRNLALSLSHSSLGHKTVADLLIDELKEDELVNLTDAILGQHFLYWATFCKSPKLFNTFLTCMRLSSRHLLEAAIGCCLNGNHIALKSIIDSLGPGIMKLWTNKMSEIFATLDEVIYDHQATPKESILPRTPLEEIRKSSKNLMSIATEYKHADIISVLENAQQSTTVKEAAFTKAIKYQESDIINTMGEKLSDMKFVDDRGDSHLHIACRYGQIELLKTQLARDDTKLNLKGFSGRTLLMTAAESGKHEVFLYLLEKGSDITLTDSGNNNLLHLSCIGGNTETINLLMSWKLFDINSRGYQLWTPLMFAACNRHHKIVQFLFMEGADLTASSADGSTAMHLAASYGDLALLKWLVETGSYDINAPGKYKFTPLMIASKAGHMPVVEYLLSKHADILITGACGCHCLHIACEEGNLDMVKLFLASGVIDIDNCGKHDFPPLWAAVKKDKVNVFKFLLCKGANLMFKTKGDNCLHFCAAKGAVGIIKELLEMETFDIDERGSRNQTPVMKALENGHTDTALLLMSRNANMQLSDNDGNNSLHYACKEGMLEIVQQLTQDSFFGFGKRKEYIKMACFGDHFQTLNYLVMYPEKYPFTSEDLWEILFIATANQSIQIFNILFSIWKEFDEFNINTRSSLNQSTILHAAGSEKIAEVLIKNGADPFIKDRFGNTALHFATERGMLPIVMTLIDQFRMDVNMRGKDGNTPLMNACYKDHFDIVSFLLDNGASTDEISSYGFNCLHFACMGGSVEIVKKLLLYKCDPDRKDSTGRTPIMLATEYEQPEIVAYLISVSVSLTAVSDNGETVLKVACFEGQLEIAKLILNSGNVDINDNSGPNKWTPLINACQAGHFAIVEFLLSKGADVTIKSAQGAYCLHLACVSGNVSIVQRLLLLDTFSVNMRGEKDWTPLMLAASDGHYELVEYLLQMGADVNLRNSSGSNCLHVVVEEGHLALVKLFMYKEPSLINTRDALGTTPIMYSLFFKKEDIFEFLYENGADITIVRHCGTDCLYTASIAGMREAVERLFCTGLFDIDNPAIHKWTPIMGACRSGQYDVYRYLLSQGASLDCVGDSGDTVFHVAAMGGNLKIVSELFSTKKFNINSVGFNNWTPLFMACEQGHPEVVNFLNANGANFRYKDSRGNTCLHIACAGGHIRVFKVLLLMEQFDVNEPNNEDITPLMQAARHGHKELVNFFMNLKSS